MKPYVCTTDTNCEAVTVKNFLPFVWLKPFICCIRYFCQDIALQNNNIRAGCFGTRENIRHLLLVGKLHYF